MQRFTFHRELTGLFTEQQNRLVYRQDELMDFIHLPYNSDSFGTQIKIREQQFTRDKRKDLVDQLNKQYSGIDLEPKVSANIQSLLDGATFTVTTGHQLSIFTGPLFFIYKILHVIRLAETLKEKYGEYNFVPVYWMASEDHDFEEIRSVELFGKTLSWESEQKGPVGRYSTVGLDVIRAEFSAYFSGEALEEVKEILANYEGKDLTEATLKLVNRLFSRYGLLIINADTHELKRSFVPVMKKEIETEFSYHAVQKMNALLEKEGMKVQVHAREINLFYMENGMRERIVHLDDGFFIEEKGKLSRDALLNLIESSPECFSPNVIMRPVYQEWILPNLCYIGGVGELAYWMQLKGVFEGAEVPYPLVGVRNSLLWIDPVNSKRIEKSGIHLEEIFHDTDVLKREHVKKHADQELDLNDVEAAFNLLREKLLSKVMNTDPGLERMALAEIARIEKQLQSVEEKLFKSLKVRHEQALTAIDQLKSRLFPANGLQERSVSLFSMCAGGKIDERIAQLHDFIDPFESDLIVIRE
ncbi:MAG: bacillithiol biosynthesis cysteine-adding enzyme BshC [Bacteroidota bacterium]